MFKRYLCALLFAFFCLPVAAQVTFPSFDSFIQINPNNTAEVIETSSLYAAEPATDFSFYRDLPVVKGKDITIVEVTVDGNKTELSSRHLGKVLRVFFQEQRPLSAGNHTFQLYYKIDHAVTFLKSADRFNWDIITNTAAFPISFARLRLELPQGVTLPEGKSYAFITAVNGTVRPAQQEDLSFWSLTPISPKTSFTLSLSLPKGVIQQPEPSFLRAPDRKGSLLWLLLFLLGCYCLGAWSSVGRDPRSRVIRCHRPPSNVSAAKAQYIYSMGKEVPLATALLSLAIKGAVEIEVRNDGKQRHQVIVRPKLRYKIMEPLPNEEDAVYYGLFATVGTRWIVDPTDFQTRKRICDTYKILQDCLRGDCASTFFNRNELYNVPSYLFLAVGAFLLSMAQPLLLVPYIILGTSLFFLSYLACHHKWGKAVSVIAIWLLAELLGILFPLQIFSFNTGAVAYVIGAILGGCFQEWIRAYTVPGRMIMDELEGFKEYLLVGEKNRLAHTNPTNSLQFFCHYLPYAYALGIPTKWTQRFENYLGTAPLKALETNGLFLPDLSDVLSDLDAFFFSIAAGGGGRFTRN